MRVAALCGLGWTLVSAWYLALTVGTSPCHILRTIPPGGFPPGPIPTMSQADVDAQAAACSQPKVQNLSIPAIGYIVIVGIGVASATGGKRDVSLEP